MLKEKLLNGEILTEKEMRNLHKEVKRIKLYGKEDRFFLSVYEIEDKLFAMNWEMEDEEPIFYQQPFLCKIENGRVFRY